MTDARTSGRGRTTAPAGPSALWMIIASSWMILVLFPGAVFTWLAFGIIAAVARRRSWWVASVVYGIAAFVIGFVPDDGGDMLRGTLYLVGIAHALIANPTWLSDLWARRENGLNIMGGPARARPGQGSRRSRGVVPSEAEGLLNAPGTSRSDYVADEAEAAPAPARKPRASRSRRSSTAAPVDREPVEPIDVNTANQRALAKLTGMDRRLAKALIAERTKRGGFGSLEDFATAAGLQPHELVRLRDEAFCSPRPRAARTFGRRVDF